MVLWMRGHYDYYKNFGLEGEDNYDTAIELWLSDQLPGGTGTPDTGNPMVVALGPCSPNPTRGVTRIDFSLPGVQAVSLDVYDVAGRHVRSLLRDERVDGGTATVVWDGADERGRDVASGVYFVRLIAGERSDSGKILVIR
jgi:hypothetical protein